MNPEASARGTRGPRTGPLVGLALGLSAVFCAGFPGLASAQALVREPYLQTGTPNSMVVRWRTSTQTDSWLSYGPAPDQLTTTLSEEAQVTEHEIQIDDLLPDTRYYYGVGTSSELLASGADHFFVTSPLPGTRRPIRIWVIGDSGQCSSGQNAGDHDLNLGCIDADAVRDRYLEYAGADTADVWLILGDNAYNRGKDSEYTEGFFEVYPGVLRNTVVWPVPGNHEYLTPEAAPYYGAFTLPSQAEAGGLVSGTEAYYSFDYANVHFIALDSHATSRSPEGAVYAWLEADLMATDADWLIAFWHHPPYTKGSHDSDSAEVQLSDMREVFVPLLEDYGLDLQLTGHSHSYERSVLIDGHYGKSNTFNPEVHALDEGDGDPGGDGAYAKATFGLGSHEDTVYSVVGSSSKNAGGLSQHPIMVTSINYEGSMVVDIDGATLDAIFIDKDGSERDRFRIEKVPEPTAVLLQIAALASLSWVRRCSKKPVRRFVAQ